MGIIDPDKLELLGNYFSPNVETLQKDVNANMKNQPVGIFFQIAYEEDFGSLCTVTFWQKVDFLISNVN